MADPRTLGFSAGVTGTAEIHSDRFMKVVGASPINTRRFTSCGLDITASIDGSSQTWLSIPTLSFASMSQTETDPLSVSSVIVANVDGMWEGWASVLKGSIVTLWRGWFDPVTHAFQGAPEVYPGKINRQEHDSESILEIKPGGKQYAIAAPWQPITAFGPAFEKLMPPRDVQQTLGGGTVVSNQSPYSYFGLRLR